MLGIGGHGRRRWGTVEFARETMVHVPMVCLVGTNHEHDIAQRCTLWKLPVMSSDVGRRNIRRSALIELSEVMRVADHRFFFEIADDPVRGPGADEVKQEKRDIEEPLDTYDDQTLEDIGFGDMNVRS